METNQNDFISTETPRIRKFYEKYSKKLYETPFPQISNFLQLLTSPIDGQPFVKFQYLTLHHQDLIITHFENSISAVKARNLSECGYLFYSNSKTPAETTHNNGPEDLLLGNERTEQKLNYPNDNSHEIKESTPFIPETNHISIVDEEERSFRDITAQINNCSTDTINCSISSNEEPRHEEVKDNQGAAQEMKKRKRKSNQQLKILQYEYEKDGFWSKDKILSVARITGLSESQVDE